MIADHPPRLPPEGPLAPVSPPSDPVQNLFRQLRQEAVRIGVYKNSAQIEAGLRGDSDLDLLVARDDSGTMRQILLSRGAIRAQPNRFHDNAHPNREDWFLPLENCGFLHLDIAIGVTIGPKYRKHYHVFGYEDVTGWHIPEAASGVEMAVVSPQDELGITLLRSLFQPVRSGNLGQADGDYAHPQPLHYRIGDEQFSCTPVSTPSGPALSEADRLHLLKAVRRQGGPGSGPIADWSIHAMRRILNAFGTRMTKALPGRSWARRSLRPQGIIVALIGPDGVGKSTQAARLQTIFGRKLRCASVYLGSNDGSWTRLRRRVRRAFSRRRSGGTKPKVRKKMTISGRSWSHAMGSAIWRLLVAIQRLIYLRRARALAASGALVICDRWPQMIEAGMLDGPAIAPPAGRRLAGLFSRAEYAIYRRMENYDPALTIHLDCDFATSYARKPGDIEEHDFLRRLDLMQRMRDRDPGVAIVDARQELDAVSASLCEQIWAALSHNYSSRNCSGWKPSRDRKDQTAP